MKQTELAALMDVSERTIQNWESGTVRPGPGERARLAELLDIDDQPDIVQLLLEASDLQLLAALTTRISQLRSAANAKATDDPEQDALLNAITEEERRNGK